MNIGIYGGTFDPVHNGHVRYARHMLSALELDKLLIVPAYRSPFKEEDPRHVADRFNMCRLAFDDPRMEVSDAEIRRGGKSYTVETVKEIKRCYGDHNYYLLVGSDQLFLFPKWYRFTEILSAATLCSVSRNGTDKKPAMELFADKELRRYGKCIICDFEPIEISSERVREGLKAGEDMSGYLPAAVNDYIKNKGLYK